MKDTQKLAYESPMIVNLGLASELTNGMGGSSTDMDGLTIPVSVPNDESAEELDIPDAY